MDLKMYYQKIRDMERGFKSTYPVVVSQETADGGTAGVKTEVSPHIASKMIVEGRAVLASEKETKEFQDHKMEAKRTADQLKASSRLQVNVVSDSEFQVLKDLQPSTKK
jgi:hypothetical protein